MLKTLNFKLGAPSLKDCVETYMKVLGKSNPELREATEDDDSKINAKCEELMQVAVLNYRFSFEMYPSQVAICIIKLACLGQTSPSGQDIFTENLATDLAKYYKYSKGRINGIEKRLRECYAKHSE